MSVSLPRVSVLDRGRLGGRFGYIRGRLGEGLSVSYPMPDKKRLDNGLVIGWSHSIALCVCSGIFIVIYNAISPLW